MPHAASGSPADNGKPGVTQGRKATGPQREVSRVAEVGNADGAFIFFATARPLDPSRGEREHH